MKTVSNNFFSHEQTRKGQVFPSMGFYNKKRSTVLKIAGTVVAICFCGMVVSAQPAAERDSQLTIQVRGDSTTKATARPNNVRKWIIGATNLVGYGGSLIALNNTWYKNYPHTSFHTFNDDGEWLQIDKTGHAWTAYNAGRASAGLWKWAGMPDQKATWIGGLSGAAYLTVIEFLDGHSSQWGWSWGDVTANIVGSGLFISQQLLWHEQRIQYKFSFHRKSYGETQLSSRATDLFGSVWYERMLKDYNAQTYWLSFNLKSFFPSTGLPAWLNLSAGYGGDGMFGGFENRWSDPNTGLPINRTGIPRVRQFYVAPDIDFTKIPTNKKWLRTVFYCMNAFKCPAPTLLIDSKGKMKLYGIYF